MLWRSLIAVQWATAATAVLAVAGQPDLSAPPADPGAFAAIAPIASEAASAPETTSVVPPAGTGADAINAARAVSPDAAERAAPDATGVVLPNAAGADAPGAARAVSSDATGAVAPTATSEPANGKPPASRPTDTQNARNAEVTNEPPDVTPASEPAASRPAPPPQGRQLPRGFIQREVRLPNGDVYRYALFLPAQYDLDETHRWPVILFMHGSGEVGSDGIKQAALGLPRFVGGRPTRFPFIVVAPQAHTLWFRGEDAQAAYAALEAVHEAYRTDRDRVYLTGLSMGGFASWEFAISRPDLFAAIAPVCGAGPKEYASNIVQMPVWAFHGELDDAVKVDLTRGMVDELKRIGGHPKYTEYPGVGHNCWDRAYSTTDLYRWLLKQRRPPPPRVIDYHFVGPIARVWWIYAEAEEDSTEPAHLHVEVDDNGHVTLTTQHVASWLITPGPDPLQPGKEINVAWNGKPVFHGEFSGALGVKPQSTSGPMEE